MLDRGKAESKGRESERQVGLERFFGARMRCVTGDAKSQPSVAASIKPTFACRDGFPIGLPRADGAAGGRSAIDKVVAVVAADLHGIHRLALGRGRGFPVGYRKGGALSRCYEWE